MASPDYSSQIEMILGWPGEYSGLWPSLGAFVGMAFGTNPIYSATDFFAQLPNFGGTPLLSTGTLAVGSTTITAVPSADIANAKVGNYIAGAGIPSGAMILSATGTSIVISLPATANGATVPLTIYNASPIPQTVLNSYIALASSSLSAAYWGGSWSIAMAFYIAHFLTLWQMTQAGSGGTAAQLANAGLAIGIKTSKSAGDVSVGSTPLMLGEGSGAYALTLYGAQFYTWAIQLGSQPLFVY